MIIIDGNAAAARAFFGTHANAPYFNEGLFTSTLTKFLINIIGQVGAHLSGVYLCVDSPSWRFKVYPEYKNKPKAVDATMYQQYKQSWENYAIDIMASLPFRVLKAAGYEGDDLVAYLVKKYHEKQKLIMSTDKDLKQLLLEPNTSYYDFREEKYITMTKTEINQLTHLLLCHGDESDCIPSIMPRHPVTNKPKYRFGEKTIPLYFDESKPYFMADKFWEFAKKEDHEQIKANLARNKTLIGLESSPVHKEFFAIREPVFDNNKIDEFFKFYIPDIWDKDSQRIMAILNRVAEGSNL